MKTMTTTMTTHMVFMVMGRKTTI